VSFLVYVAAPFQDAANVRGVIDRALRDRGLSPSSTWADRAGVVDVEGDAALEVARENDLELRASDVVLVLARPGVGGEMFAEARLALEWGKPLVWFGRRSLSAWRSGVVRAESFEEALDCLVLMQRLHADGARGLLLAHLAGGPR
jgi:hypothetical protein